MSSPDDNVNADRLVVRTELGDPRRSYKCWVRFDVSGVDVQGLTSATLVTTLWRDKGDCELDISYLNDDVVDNIAWDTNDLTWNNASGNDPISEGLLDPNETTLLGRPSLIGGLAGDQFTVDALEALQTDTDGVVQFVLHNASAYIQVAHHHDPCEAWRPFLILSDEPLPTAVLIVNDINLPNGFDQAQKDRLEALGYQVTLATGADVKNDLFAKADAEGYDLLVVSESIGSADVNKLIGVKVPMLHEESYGWSRHFFTAGLERAWTTPVNGTLDVVDDTHPIVAAARLSVGSVPFFTDPNVALTTDLVASLVPGAVNLVQTIDADSNDVTCIFAIEAGTELAHASLAANRIVGFSLPGNNSYGADVMTDEAWALFDAAIAWLNPATPQIEVAGELLVDVSAADRSAGTEIWVNNGTLGDFTFVTQADLAAHPDTHALTPGLPPAVEEFEGVPVVNIMSSSANLVAYTGPPSVPGIEGDSDRTIEAWVADVNTIPDSQVIVA